MWLTMSWMLTNRYASSKGVNTSSLRRKAASVRLTENGHAATASAVSHGPPPGFVFRKRSNVHVLIPKLATAPKHEMVDHDR
ncbi:MAG: hypothetical protein EBS01_01060 [Verrucomicrobia bacterium]|nr:hypothetical protein [Verrucomicrobiota bacterium]